MINKKQIIILLLAAAFIILVAPASAVFLGQAQIQLQPAEALVKVADRAGQQVKNLIDLVYANETALQKIEEVNLIDELEGNVTLYGEGVGNLTEAHDALETTDYEAAIDYATEALRIFREVFSSIHIILEKAGLQKGQLIDNQGLLEAIARQLQRIDRLREILPEDAPDEVKQLLNDAEALLDINAARALLLEGNAAEVISSLQEARVLISQVYDYLKTRAEESNAWRIYGYCEGVLEIIRERFRQGNQSGIDFTDALKSLGYQSENQFMETLEHRIQEAQGKADLQDALQELEAIGQMVQEMNHALTQEMNRYQGGSGSASGGGSGSGSGDGGMSGGYGYGSGGKP
ncbi:MAG: hypothetical protein NWF09_05220 [Candidatus Bathyarchaeota archaeon]|nr:hypothetical protein [Candidatus Bathyarchaeota archaeon]